MPRKCSEEYYSECCSLFIYFDLETTPFIPKGYVAKERRKSQRPSSIGPLKNKRNPSPSTVRCVQNSGAGVPPYKTEMKRKLGKRRTI